jgi:hypothetical protein
MRKNKLFQTIGFAALLAALLFASCEQEAFVPVNLTGELAPLKALVKAAPKPIQQPISWRAFTPLPFGDVSATEIRALTASTHYLVAATLSGGAAYAARRDIANATWDPSVALTGLGSSDPSAAFLLNCYYLVTSGGNNTKTGSYSMDASNWSATGVIGFGTKAGLYGPPEQVYVVAGQRGQAAFTFDLSVDFDIIPNTVTGWPSSGNLSYINAAAYGAGRYVFGGGSGRIAYTDSILQSSSTNPWSTAIEPFGDEDFVNAIAYGGKDTFVAVGNNSNGRGVIAYSTNRGTIWQLATYTDEEPKILSTGIFTLTYGDGYFVAVNNNGNAAYSENGSVWTDSAKSPLPGASPRFNAVTFYPATNTFITGGVNNNGMLLFTSEYP